MREVPLPGPRLLRYAESPLFAFRVALDRPLTALAYATSKAHGVLLGDPGALEEQDWASVAAAAVNT